MARDGSMWRWVCLAHGFGDGDKEGREREWNKQHHHRLGNLKDAGRGDQPFSVILREGAGNLDGREGLNGLSSPPADSFSSQPREVSEIFSYRRHSRSRISFVRALLFIYYKLIIKILILIPIYLSTQASTGGTAENSSIPRSSPPSCPPHRPLRCHPINSNLPCSPQIMARRRSRKLQHQSIQHTHCGLS